MHLDLDDAGIDRALREERSLEPSPYFVSRVMRSVRDEADTTQAIPFPWVRVALGPGFAGLMLLLLLGTSAGSAPAWSQAVVLTVETACVTMAGTFAMIIWSVRLGRR